jgi:PAS domain-containing protein
LLIATKDESQFNEEGSRADVHSRTAVRGETGHPDPGEPWEHLGAILNALPAMVGYWDTHLRNRGANRAYVEFFGLTPKEIRGRHASEVLGPKLYESTAHRTSTCGRTATV